VRIDAKAIHFTYENAMELARCDSFARERALTAFYRAFGKSG
jgi:hypothetical protein